MYGLRGKKSAFTLAETVIVCSVFAVMVVWIILMINRAFLFMNNTRVLVRAANFAREWVEMVYNIRDTNRRKYSWEKDKHRLNAWTGSKLLSWWIYIIGEWITWYSHDSYIYADYLTWNIEFYDNMDVFFSNDNVSGRNESRIGFSWTYSYYSGGTIAIWNLEDLLWWSGIEFYRLLRVYGVYEKNTTNDSDLIPNDRMRDQSPKELRFCVKVFYELNGWHHASELCSIMTNFME